MIHLLLFHGCRQRIQGKSPSELPWQGTQEYLQLEQSFETLITAHAVEQHSIDASPAALKEAAAWANQLRAYIAQHTDARRQTAAALLILMYRQLLCKGRYSSALEVTLTRFDTLWRVILIRIYSTCAWSAGDAGCS